MRGSAYNIFGLKPGASEEEIRKRYRKLVKKYHPDVNKDADAEKTFVEIQEAYEILMAGTSEEIEYTDQAAQQFQTRYAEYQAHARQQFQARKKKEEEDLAKLYVRLQTGPVFLVHRIIAYAGIAIVIVLCLDLLLPKHQVPGVITSYSTDVYQSMNGNLVSLAVTKNGDRFFLNAFSNRFFDINPFINIEKTAILHQSTVVYAQSQEFLQKIPIHFSFYWAQFVLFPFLLVPCIFIIYKKKDAFFIMGSYFSRYVSGILMLYFLATEERWYHLFTLGFY
jgi:curved DNA-binding protein CbpA